MAKRRKTPQKSSGGSTLFGVLLGLILGLGAAAAVAWFVTQVPMPFLDKASRDPAQTLLPGVRDAPDPNIGLYGKNGAAGHSATGPTATAPIPLPGATEPAGSGLSDDIGALLSTLGAPSPQASPASPTPAPEAAPQRPAPPAEVAAATQTTYYLQAGAFRSGRDAEAVKARILMLGLAAQVQPGQSNGNEIHRVRVGPFQGIDEMNRSRVRLSEANIESSVVRP